MSTTSNVFAAPALPTVVNEGFGFLLPAYIGACFGFAMVGLGVLFLVILSLPVLVVLLPLRRAQPIFLNAVARRPVFFSIWSNH